MNSEKKSGPPTYRDILFFEYTKRKAKNSRYSLRAYSQLLGMTSSRLNEIFSKKRGLSPELAQKIMHKLEFPEFEGALFLDLVQVEEARSPLERKLAAQRIREKWATYFASSSEVFESVGDWYYPAILSYLALKGPLQDPAIIARVLGLEVARIEAALDRLTELSYAEFKDEKWQIGKKRLWVPSDSSSSTVKNHHLKILEKAQTALYHQSLPDFFFQSQILAIAEEDVPAMKKSISEFLQGLTSQLAASPRKDAVYAFQVHFFELTEKPNE